MHELNKDRIHKKLDRLENLQKKSLFFRVINRLSKYMLMYLVRGLCRLNILRKIEISIKPFWGMDSIVVDLPAHADIFLYGSKVSQSDFLLQHYLNNCLKEGAVFYDIGASIGYYSLFASKIVGNRGMIFSIEPSQTAYKILKRNTAKNENIKTVNIAIGDSNKNCIFNEFSTRYNEYNTLIIDDFIKQSKWFKYSTPVQTTIPMKTLDAVIDESKHYPDVVKIDIEGGEALLLHGMIDSINNIAPDLIFRYWPNNRDNATQTSVFNQLFRYGYEVYSLKNNQKIHFDNRSEYEFEYVLLKKK